MSSLFENIKVGDQVKSITKGWGEVIECFTNNFYVKFPINPSLFSYTTEGKQEKSDIFPEIVKLKPTKVKKNYNTEINRTWYKHQEQATFVTQACNNLQAIYSYIYDICPNKEFNTLMVGYSGTEHKWITFRSTGLQPIGAIAMPINAATAMAKDLNAGNVLYINI